MMDASGPIAPSHDGLLLPPGTASSLEWVDKSVALGFPKDRLVWSYQSNFCQAEGLNSVSSMRRTG